MGQFEGLPRITMTDGDVANLELLKDVRADICIANGCSLLGEWCKDCEHIKSGLIVKWQL